MISSSRKQSRNYARLESYRDDGKRHSEQIGAHENYVAELQLLHAQNLENRLQKLKSGVEGKFKSKSDTLEAKYKQKFDVLNQQYTESAASLHANTKKKECLRKQLADSVATAQENSSRLEKQVLQGQNRARALTQERKYCKRTR